MCLSTCVCKPEDTVHVQSPVFACWLVLKQDLSLAWSSSNRLDWEHILFIRVPGCYDCKARTLLAELSL